MLSIIYVEIIKLKRSKVLWLLPLGSLLPAFLSFMALSNNYKQTHIIMWESLFKNDVFLMNLLMGPALISLITGFIVAREYQDRTVNQLFTYPLARFKFFLGKIFIMIPLIAGVLGMTFLLTLGFGLLRHHEPLTANVLWTQGKAFLKMLPMFIAWVPLAATVSIIGQNYIPGMALGVGAVVFNIIVIQSTDYNMIFPYTAPMMLSGGLGKGAPDIDYTKGIISLILTFAIPLIFSMYYYTKADVHSG